MAQMNLISDAAVLAVVCWLIASDSARAAVSRLLYGDRSGHQSVGVNWATVAVLVSFMLLITMEPEARVFLMFIDAVGMDFFLLLLVCQFRSNAWHLRDSVALPMWRRLTTWAPFPMDIPTRGVVKEFPVLSCCAVVGVLVSAGYVLVMFLPFVLGLAVAS